MVSARAATVVGRQVACCGGRGGELRGVRRNPVLKGEPVSPRGSHEEVSTGWKGLQSRAGDGCSSLVGLRGAIAVGGGVEGRALGWVQVGVREETRPVFYFSFIKVMPSKSDKSHNLEGPLVKSNGPEPSSRPF